MRIIPQMSLFDYNENENLGDLERLQMVLDYMPDEKIIQKLYKMRGFELKSIRNKDGSIKILLAPPNSAYTNFLNNLKQCKEEIKDIFDELVEYMYKHLDHFGEILAVDGKAIQSYATNYSKKAEQDGRRDKDADWCRKEYTSSINEKGEKVIKTVKWFGYRLHLLVDATYELPVEYRLTKASCSEQTQFYGILDNLKEKRPKVLDTCEYLLGDRGYDSTTLIKKLEGNGIIPVIDICNKWRDGEKTKQYKNTHLTYTFSGKVYYTNDNGKEIELMYKGYDKGSDSARYGFHPKYKDKRIFRIKLDEDRRIFLPVGRHLRSASNMDLAFPNDIQ